MHKYLIISYFINASSMANLTPPPLTPSLFPPSPRLSHSPPAVPGCSCLTFALACRWAEQVSRVGQ